jgi:hypothetical protein
MATTRTELVPARRTTLRALLAIVGALALAGWGWSFTSVHIPDALWLATVALTLVFVGLLVYGLVTRSRRVG